MHNPLVSIIIPTFNRAHLISETIDSIRAQSYQNWECIIVDDGSNDDTEQTVLDYIKKDSRIQFHHRPENRKKGANACRNYGFELSKGEFINWFDSDDVMLPNKIEDQITELLSDDEWDVVIGNSFHYNFKTKDRLYPWRNKLYSNKLITDFVLQTAGWQTGDPIWKKKSIMILKFNEDLHSSQDWEFHIKALSMNMKIHFIDKCYSHIRYTKDSIKNTHGLRKIKSDFTARKNIFKLLKDNKLLEFVAAKKMLNENYSYFESFSFHKQFVLALYAFYEIIKITFFTKEYKLFFSSFIMRYPFKILRKAKILMR